MFIGVEWIQPDDNIRQYIYRHCLVKDGDIYYTWKNDNWEVVNLVDIYTEGFENFEEVDKSFLKGKQVVVRSEVSEAPQMNATYLSSPQVIKASGDLNLAQVEDIKSFFLEAQESLGGIIRIATSGDGGNTYYAFNGTDIIQVDINDLNNFKNNGATIENFNDTNFNIINTENRLRNAYYIEANTVEDINDTYTSLLRMTADFKGRLRRAFARYKGEDNIERGEVEEVFSHDKTEVFIHEAGTYIVNILE